MSAFVDMLMRLKDRAEQELRSSTSDAIPNPVAGLVGPQELHYNPLRDLPGIGGAINLTANGPLHAAGLVQEGLAETAKMLAGYGMQAGATIDRLSGDHLTPERQAVDAAILAQGLAHPGRSLDAARTGPDSGVAYLGGAAEQLANLGNYTNPLGAGGRALSEAPGLLGTLGKGIMGAAAVGEASNRAMMLPAGLLPRVGKSLAELPEFLKAADAPRAIAPLIAAVRGQVDADLASRAAFDALPDTSLTGRRGNAGRQFGPELPRTLGPEEPPLYGPDFPERGNVPGDQLLPGIGRDGKKGLGPELPPTLGPDVPPEFGPAFPERGNLPADQLLPGVGRDGRRGIGPELPPAYGPPVDPALNPAYGDRGNVPGDRLIPGVGRDGKKGLGPELPEDIRRILGLDNLPLAGNGAATGAFPASVAQESPLIRQLTGAGEAAQRPLEVGLAQDQVDFLHELQNAVQRGDPREIRAAEEAASGMMEIPPERVRQAMDEVYSSLATEERQGRLTAIEGSPYFQAFQYFNRDGNLKLVNPKTGKRLANRSGAEVWNLPGSGYDEYAAAALQGVEGGGNQNYGQTADEFWGRAKEALAEYRALKAPVAEAAGRAAAAGEALPEAIPAHPELDAMDALRGRASAENIFDLFRREYGTTKNFNAVTGVGSLNAEGRLITADGEDKTRSLLAYLLHRGDLSEGERDAFQRGAFAVKRPDLPGAAAATPGAETAVAAITDQPPTLRDLATDPQFSGQELPGPGYFARKLNISQQEVNRGLAALQGEGAIAPLNKWYGLKPEPPPAALGIPDVGQYAPVADDARAAWQREYVGQSKAGTDILSTDVAGSGVGQADMNAMSPAERMAALRKLVEAPAPASPVDDLFGTAAEQASTAPTPKAGGGDIAAGGGGMGGTRTARGLSGFMEGAHPLLLNTDGTPKRFYHGTGAGDYTQFRIPEKPGDFGRGVYFTERPERAADYAGQMGDTFYGKENAAMGAGAGPNVKPAYVNLKNPYLWDKGSVADLDIPPAELTERLLARGHDGLIKMRRVGGGEPYIEELVVFDPQRIKSATGNNGMYDPAAASVLGLQFQPTRLGVAASGAGIGGLAGLMAADTTDDNHQDDWGGAVGGALAGAALGAGIASPGGVRNLKLAKTVGGMALDAEKQAFATGATDFSWKNFAGQWAAQTVEHFRNLFEEPLSSLPMLLNEGGSPRMVINIANETKDMINAGKRGSELVPAQASQWLDDLGLAGQKFDIGTEGFKESMGVNEQALNPILSAINGAIMGAAPSTKNVPVFGIAAKAGLEALAPMRSAIHHTLDNISKTAFRYAIIIPALEDATAQARQVFDASVLAKTGQDLAALGLGDRFSAADVEQALLAAGKHQSAAPLAAEWDRYAVAAKGTAEQAAKDAFGDFSKFDPTNATAWEKVRHGAEQGFRKVVPFSSWYLRAMPIAAKIAADHPAWTLALLALNLDMLQDVKDQGLPAYLGGKVPIDSNTLVLGKVADTLTAGKDHATGFLSPLASLLPYRVDSLAAAAEDLPDDATMYQRINKWMGVAGFQFNPLIKAVAYASNNDYKRPGDLSRTSGYESAFGGPKVGSLAQGPLDTIRKMAGGTVSTTTPVDRRVAQLVYDTTGLPINAKENAALAAATLDPNHPLVKQAEREVGEAAVARNTVGLTLPGGLTASSDLDLKIAKAREAEKASGVDPFPQQTPEQAAMEAVFAKAYPLQYAMSKGQPAPVDPLTQVYRGADTKGRAYQALAAWEDENAAMKYFAPTYYGAYKQELMQQLGLSPY